MFADVLNDEFLLAAAERTRLYLEKVVERWDQPQPQLFVEGIDDGPLAYFFEEDIDDALLANVSADDIREVIGELGRASVELQNERGRETARICIPSIPILAILQSQLTEAFELRPDAYARLDDDIVDWQIPEDIDAMLGGMVVMDLFGRYAVARPWYLGDPRWLWMKVVVSWYKFKKKVTFGGLPKRPVTIAHNARIILVGDWGSGLRRAQDVAGKIQVILKKGFAEGKEQHVIHLGDVYYTGSKKEYKDNFLPYWPVNQGEPVGSFIVCGNHDMYRGGHDYYGTALADARFARQDHKSVFALRNDNWQFLGLDTAYDEKQLSNGQDKWIRDQLDTAGNRRTTILSHHPLWSTYKQEAGEELRNQIGPVLDDRRIDAWFWGHEHRCVVYNSRNPVDFTSCVGHGGIPSYLTAAEGDPYPPHMKYEYRQRYGHSFEPWNTFGFAVIDLDGRNMHIRYINEFGKVHWREHLPG
ncbi:MAG: metallophosphoesterase [Mycobacterium sp.]